MTLAVKTKFTKADYGKKILIKKKLYDKSLLSLENLVFIENFEQFHCLSTILTIRKKCFDKLAL